MGREVLRPNRGLVVVLKSEKQDVMTEGGVYLPENAERGTFRGRVLSVGEPDKPDHPAPCGRNDVILFSKYAGNESFVNGRPLTIMRFDDVLAVVTEEGE